MSLPGKIQNIVVGLMQSYFGLYRSGGTTILDLNGSEDLRILAQGYTFRDNSDNTIGQLSVAGNWFYNGYALQGGGVSTTGAATQYQRILVKKTSIADNTATDVITVTVPNANQSAAIKVWLISANGSTDAFESTRTAEGAIAIARTSGANAVAAAATLAVTGIATVAAGATHTLAYGVSAISGAVGATNTFTIQVTIDDSGNVGGNQVMVVAELMNSQSSGVTMVAA